MITLLDRPAALVTVARGPNWFASVMGTGIVATAAAGLPVAVPGLRAAATVVWAAAAVLLVALTGQLARRRITAQLGDPVMAQFWGAPPMALLTVAAGTLLLGAGPLGARPAGWAAAVLWTAGTLLGLVVGRAVPYRTIRRRLGPDAVSAGRLMPVVPPMVSAATGALLVPHAPAAFRLDLLLACYAMAGVSLVAAAVVIGQVWSALAAGGPGPARTVPTLWIVLGPLGQSVTAAHLLGRAADGVLPEPYASGAAVLAVLYGVPVLGFALFWAAFAAAVTLRTARAGLPFSLTWWSFTFPVGTVVTAASGLAARTGSPALTGLAVLLYAVLIAAWLTVAARTIRGLVTRTL